MLDPLAANGVAPKLSPYGLVPVGGILLWPVATAVPGGYHACDGTDGSLDLSSVPPPGLLCYIQRMT